MAHDVFISYSSKDKLTADAICHALEHTGVRCWIAPRDVRAGFKYGAEIIGAIRDCRAMVLVFSVNSSRSEHVQNEIERAFGHEKIIIPFRIENAPMDDNLEYFLSSKHWIDAYPGDSEFKNLVRAARVALGLEAETAPAPAPAPPAAPTAPTSPPPAPVPLKESGAVNRYANTIGNMRCAAFAARQGDWIYFCDGQALCKMRLDGTDEQRLIALNVSSIGVTGDDVFYKDGLYLYRIGTDGKGRKTIIGFVLWNHFIADGWIYFSNTNDRDVLYKVRTDGSEFIKLCDIPFSKFVFAHENFVYFSSDEGWHRVGTDGTGYRKLDVNGSCPNVVGDWIYYLDEEFNSIHRVRLDGSGDEELAPQKWLRMVVHEDGYLYCQNYGFGELYRAKLGDEGNMEKLIGESIVTYALAGDWIVFKLNRSGGLMCRMKTDATGLVQMHQGG